MPTLKPEAKRYKNFHGHAPEKITRVNIPWPKALVYLGEGLAIEYRSDKHAMGSRKARDYRHLFKKGVTIYTDKAGRTLFIKGGKFRVTDWLRD
jgi:hypothetical protein